MMTKHFGAVFGTVASAALLGLALAATPTSAAYLLNTASAGHPNASFNADGWNGVAGLGRPFSGPGRYWLAVEGLIDPISFVPLGSFLAPAGGLSMPGATAFAAGSGYQLAPGVQFGARISGFVPEPGSSFARAGGAGLGGVSSRLRRRGLAAPGF